LKIRGFTELPTGFQKVFTEQKIINWLKEPEYLAYLLYRLYSNDYKAIKVYKRGYFKSAQAFIYNYTDTVVKKFTEGELKELSHNVTKRNADGYIKLRERVDSLLCDIFKK
jgi:hypothetical protein